MKDEKFFCKDCYISKFAPKCSECNESIEGKYVNFLGKVIHHKCFKCGTCKQQIMGEYYAKEDLP